MSNNDEYHKDFDRVSKTMLTVAIKSTFDYYRYYVSKEVSPPGPKTQMVIGSAVHKILLEKQDPLHCLAVYPDSCYKSNATINPTPARKFESENQDKFVVRAKDAETILSVCEAVREHELGLLLKSDEAVFEQPLFWTCKYTQLQCRIMCDFYIDLGDEILAYDLKTTADIYPVGIRRTSRNFKYWLQDAHYSEGLKTLFGKPVRFKFWFVEIDAPYRIAPYEYPEQSRETATTAYLALMSKLATCYRTNQWVDEWTRSNNLLELSPWDVDTTETELEGFEDDE